jgi:hypothetical protein
LGGWPSVSPALVRKDHRTDWITAQTGKGLSLKAIEFKPAAIQDSGNTAVLCYWMGYQSVDKSGNRGAPTFRITHTWIKAGQDWRIIGGISMPEAATPPK